MTLSQRARQTSRLTFGSPRLYEAASTTATAAPTPVGGTPGPKNGCDSKLMFHEG